MGKVAIFRLGLVVKTHVRSIRDNASPAGPDLQANKFAIETNISVFRFESPYTARGGIV